MEDRLARLLEKYAIVDTINRLFVSMDRRDWPAIVACLAPEVHYDMTSVTGGEPVSLQGEQIAQLWQDGYGQS